MQERLEARRLHLPAERLAALAVAALLAAPAVAADRPTPRCFGAPSRAPHRPCHNPALRLVSRPSFTRALLTPNYPCTPLRYIGDRDDRAAGAVLICAMGEPKRTAERTVLLLGDSHALAWEAAFADMADRLHWRVLNMNRSHCPFSFAVRDLPQPEEGKGCRRFNRRVIRWLGRHGEVDTVFAVHETGGTPMRTPPGTDPYETEVRGTEAAFAALPRTVRHVVAVRDNPFIARFRPVVRCVRRAKRAGHPPGTRCAVPRAAVLERDAALEAARRLGEARYQTIDLTRVFCDRRRCFPVIGGAFVYKDGNHLTRVFSETLGRLLKRRVRALVS